MKRIPRKTLSLLLLTLFAVGLLAAPASADEVVGEVEPPAPEMRCRKRWKCLPT